MNINTPKWEEEKNMFVRKGIIYIGIALVSVVTFYMIAYGLYEGCRFLYWEYDMIGWLYKADWFDMFIFAVGALASNELYARLKRICGLHS